jgi:hypothetical protein
MTDKRVIDLFKQELSCLTKQNPHFPKDSREEQLFLMWFMVGYGCGFESQEHKVDELRDVLEFYAKPSVWGTDTHGVKTAIDPVDQEVVENDHSTWGVRGGKKAREILKKLFQDHCDRMDF